jgi:hypothetical protein
MSRAEQYRSLAESVRARASSEPSLILKGEWENLAVTYDRLAEQSEDPELGSHIRPALGSELAALNSEPGLVRQCPLRSKADAVTRHCLGFSHRTFRMKIVLDRHRHARA